MNDDAVGPSTGLHLKTPPRSISLSVLSENAEGGDDEPPGRLPLQPQSTQLKTTRNGHTNGRAQSARSNGIANGSNGHANGHANGHSNGHANGHANGIGNG